MKLIDEWLVPKAWAVSLSFVYYRYYVVLFVILLFLCQAPTGGRSSLNFRVGVRFGLEFIVFTYRIVKRVLKALIIKYN